MKKKTKINIKELRKIFKWTQRYGKNGRLLKRPVTRYLKDLKTDHIYGILKYFTEKLKEGDIMNNRWRDVHLMFIEELIYRNNNESS